jgi:hypothetical protein
LKEKLVLIDPDGHINLEHINPEPEGFINQEELINTENKAAISHL